MLLNQISWIGVLMCCCLANRSVNSAAFDADFTPTCKAEWQELTKTKLKFKDKPKIKYSKTEMPREVDDLGYVLIMPEKALTAEGYSVKPGVSVFYSNQHSFWAAFKCTNNMLVHDHCRMGRNDDPQRLYIHPRRYFDTTDDKLRDGDDGMVYGCHEGDRLSQLKAEVAPQQNICSDYYVIIYHNVNEKFCHRIDGSGWCGFPANFIENGCLDDLDSQEKADILMVGKTQVMVSVKNEDKARYSWMNLKLVCKNKKFNIEACEPPNPGKQLKRGQFLRLHGLAYVCPKKSDGYSFKQLPTAIGILPEIGKTTAMKLIGYQEIA